MDTISTFTTILILATLVEALVEYLVKPLFGPPILPEAEAASPDDALPGLLIRYSAATIGVLLCLTYRADLLILANLNAPLPWVGFVITGILIGRGANFVHDFTSRWFTRPVVTERPPS